MTSSPTDIAMGVDKALEAKENTMSDEDIDAIGAGDQGMMFGYACSETEEYMPYPIAWLTSWQENWTEVRKNGTLPYLRPDGKTQGYRGSTMRTESTFPPGRGGSVPRQHGPEVSQSEIHGDIKKYVFDPILPKDMIDEETKFFINPTGRFVIGGPHGDSGLTGRKIIVEHLRRICPPRRRRPSPARTAQGRPFRCLRCPVTWPRTWVAAGLADKCELQLSYAIGVAHPTSIQVETSAPASCPMRN